MFLNHITLNQFRCYAEPRTFTFSPEVTGIVGENARGKTSVLEAVYMISRGRGFREKEELELLTFGAPHGEIAAQFLLGSEVQESAIAYARQEERLQKKYFVNKAPIGHMKYVRAQPHVVLFAPHHIDIIVHGPSYRREYVDSVLASVDQSYAQALKVYEATLRRRNALLEQYETMQTLEKDIVYWDDLLLRSAHTIQTARAAYVAFMNTDPLCAGKTFRVQYLENTLNAHRLQELFPKEAAARRTLAGPQKDDFSLSIKDETSWRNVHMFASRSQQRLSILWLKMRELERFVSEGREPILLLDDVYSEFDAANRRIITSIIPRFQTIITATEEIELPTDIVRQMEVLRV